MKVSYARFSQCSLEAVLAVQATLGGDKDSRYYVAESNLSFQIPVIIIVAIVWIIIVGFISSARSKHYKKHNKDDYFGAALMAAWLFGPRGRGGIGGFGKGGFGGGGFGGFGGGGFGGGGASGGW